MHEFVDIQNESMKKVAYISPQSSPNKNSTIESDQEPSDKNVSIKAISDEQQ